MPCCSFPEITRALFELKISLNSQDNRPLNYLPKK